MVSAENLSKSFARQALLEDTGFKINPRERVGLVGRNGHGKTTLLKMIIGEEQPDAGQIIVPKNYRIGYVRQHLDFTEDTVLAEGMKGLPQTQADQHWKVEKVLAGLGFSPQDMKRSPFEFSGGYQVRLNLAKVLVSEPDLLLLDEPTNYLDITSIRWIERFLASWPRELILVTHDRTFMDKIVTHTMGIHRRKIRKIQGDTGKYYTQIAQDEEVYEKTRLNDERKRREMEAFINQFRAKARLVGLVQSRIRTIEKMEKKEKLEKIKALEFSFRYEPFVGKYVLAAHGLSFSWDPASPLIRDVSITLRPGERVCIIGPNGKGKTTLMKLLSGGLKPDEGEIVLNPKTVTGVFEQTNVSNLVDSRTVEEEISMSHPDIDRQKARDICGAMMFEGDYALKKIEVLSGGEKSRVMLGKLLASPVNLLFLDEPTNHLDMESNDALLAALDNFEGTVVMVTHNEMFLHALAERLVIFRDGSIEVFEGGYQRFLDKGGWGDELENIAAPKRSKGEKNGQEKLDRKELRRRRAEVITERSRVIGPLEEAIARAESGIEEREQRLKLLHAAMQEATQARDGKRISGISVEIHACEEEIEALFTELERLTREHDEQSALFEELLSGLEQP
ncbi:MAG: ATP-binding cassette domain-containing protein [Desulfomonilia bacterium]